MTKKSDVERERIIKAGEKIERDFNRRMQDFVNRMKKGGPFSSEEKKLIAKSEKQAHELQELARRQAKDPKIQRMLRKHEEMLERIDKAQKVKKQRGPRGTGSYKAGQSCTKMGKEHKYEDKGSYWKCSVCKASKTKPKSERTTRSRVESM